MRLLTRSAFALILVCGGLVRANAQMPSPSNAPPPLTAAVRRAVVDTLGARLRQHYVDADTGVMIATRVHQRLVAGAYDTITSPGRFAEALTVDMRSVNGDRHLNVTYSPGNPGQRPGPQGLQMPAVLPQPVMPTSPPPSSPGLTPFDARTTASGAWTFCRATSATWTSAVSRARRW